LRKANLLFILQKDLFQFEKSKPSVDFTKRPL